MNKTTTARINMTEIRAEMALNAQKHADGQAGMRVECGGRVNGRVCDDQVTLKDGRWHDATGPHSCRR